MSCDQETETHADLKLQFESKIALQANQQAAEIHQLRSFVFRLEERIYKLEKLLQSSTQDNWSRPHWQRVPPREKPAPTFTLSDAPEGFR